MLESPKVIVTVLYPRKEMNFFDMKYYLERHIPTAKDIWGGFGMTSCVVTELEKSSDYAVQAILGWKDIESWATAQNAESNQKVMDDLDGFKFTNVTPIMLVGNVKE